MLTQQLIRHFVKDRDDTRSPQVRYAYGRLASVTGLVCNLLLFAIKLLAGILSGSLAIIADAFNNLTDAGSSVISLFGFVLSGQKAASEHPFGHGRIEYLAGIFISAATYESLNGEEKTIEDK